MLLPGGCRPDRRALLIEFSWGLPHSHQEIVMYALLLLGLLARADAAKDNTAIQGTWVIESITINGKRQDDYEGKRLAFKDGTILFIKAEFKDGEKIATYKLDPAKAPRTIDIVFEIFGKQECAAIYQ